MKETENHSADGKDYNLPGSQIHYALSNTKPEKTGQLVGVVVDKDGRVTHELIWERHTEEDEPPVAQIPTPQGNIAIYEEGGTALALLVAAMQKRKGKYHDGTVTVGSEKAEDAAIKVKLDGAAAAKMAGDEDKAVDILRSIVDSGNVEKKFAHLAHTFLQPDGMDQLNATDLANYLPASLLRPLKAYARKLTAEGKIEPGSMGLEDL